MKPARELPWGGRRNIEIIDAQGEPVLPAVFSVDPTEDPEEARREAIRRGKRRRDAARRKRRKLDRKAAQP